MEHLFTDIIKSIVIYLSEYQKLLFLSSNKYLHRVKNMVIWNTSISIHFAPIVSYCNNFSKVKIDGSIIRLEKLVCKLARNKKCIDDYFDFATEIIIITPISNILAKFLIPSHIVHCKIKDQDIAISALKKYM